MRLVSRHQGTILSAVLVFAWLGLFAGSHPHHVKGVSPYFSAFGEFQDQTFLRIQRERQNNIFTFHREARYKIQKILARYETGLDKKYHRLIPEWIVLESSKYNYDPLFITAIIITESSFNNWAKSHRGALGLMQIRPRTGHALAFETEREWKGEKSLFDPSINIALGIYYLDKLIKRFHSVELALTAYNHGPSKLNRYLKRGYQPQRYYKKVMANYQRLQTSRA
ncbi:MAG: transglycosylase SLT domain-containing protein [Nitrospinaceae bacterium]|nr:lytic transglycosylase domain-containing protein [Nitrospinaceae bacterium]NIR55339.1 lytic transglycosylase domain-containing protein [Nitrospinaceae bacterium]NIS85778.1 lytic transglycosylase domain-containing protein [Nitrospinaceae bacterium]NIT82628.1 lytic transglycosylase domain-containing protein [Nitrospinaceae bacterium]NIU44833.1 lytic transglycosylase domain-containing protein [Nitrospinaceae bacterium]